MSTVCLVCQVMGSVHLCNAHACACSQVLVYIRIHHTVCSCSSFGMLPILYVNTVMELDNGGKGGTRLDDSGSSDHD